MDQFWPISLVFSSPKLWGSLWWTCNFKNLHHSRKAWPCRAFVNYFGCMFTVFVLSRCPSYIYIQVRTDTYRFKILTGLLGKIKKSVIVKWGDLTAFLQSFLCWFGNHYFVERWWSSFNLLADATRFWAKIFWVLSRICEPQNSCNASMITSIFYSKR